MCSRVRAAAGGHPRDSQRRKLMAEEGIQFEKTVGYVRLDDLAAPVPRNKRFGHYLCVDVKLEVMDDGNVKRV